ncbi:MAG: PD40 domain-containing protein, partial [Bacteroidales bacterium]|nr:PD40 domain-containing protein [Bacteroidales bacterium]
MKFLPSGHPFGILWKLKTNKTLNRLDDIPSGHPFGILWKFVCLFILLFLSYNILYSQNNEFTKENFEGNKDELKKALSFIKEGDKLIAGNNIRFRESLANYLEADKINSNSALLNYKIGKCYLNITLEKYKSISYLEKAYKLNPTCQDDILYLLAQAYQLNYEFDKAITNYLAYMRTTPPGSSDKLINKKIDECKTAKELIKRPVDVYIENLGPVINGKFPDYSPIISADESMLIFTSRRDNTVGGKIADFDDKYYEDIYITYWQQDSGRWTTPFNPKPPVNTELHDATVGLSPDGKRILIYKTNREGDIFESVIDSNQNFTKPKALNNNINTNFHESVA